MKGKMQNTLKVLVNGKPIKVYAHGNRLFVEGRPGQEYSLEVKNNYASRKLVSVSVDSINVVDGQTGSKQGYVLAGYSSYEIKGFRQSNSEIASFKFAPKRKSYASKSEATNFSTQDCGVIGLVLFNEREKPQSVQPLNVQHHHYHYEYQQPQWWYPGYGQWNNTSQCSGGNITMDSSASSLDLGNIRNTNLSDGSSSYLMNCSSDGARGMSATACNFVSGPFSLGTEWGDTKDDYVTNTEFDIGSTLEAIEIFYGTREDLINLGVDISKETKISFPQAWPNGFCKPPRN